MQTLDRKYIKFNYLYLLGMDAHFGGSDIDAITICDTEIIIKKVNTEILLRYNGTYYLEYEWIDKVPPTPKTSINGGHV